MKKEKIIEKLNEFKLKEIHTAFRTRGSSYGNERFSTWRRTFTSFLKDKLPGQEQILVKKLDSGFGSIIMNEPDCDNFWRTKGNKMISYIDSLCLDIENDELDYQAIPSDLNERKNNQPSDSRNKVFIVHGHDGEAKLKVARFVEKLGLEAVILHEKANQGMTIIEKIESHTNVGFGIVLYTPDDKGNNLASADKNEYLLRARQNVVFEHGYLMARIGRSKVVPLVSETLLELPSDISGVVYIADKNWEIDIAKEMKAAGYEIDLNDLV